MKVDDAVDVVHQLQRYSDLACQEPEHRGLYVRQMLFPMATRGEFMRGVRETDLKKVRYVTEVWVRLDRLKSFQHCLSRRSLVYHVRRANRPKDLPAVVKLSNGWYLIWDGNHRSTAARLLGRTWIKCDRWRAQK